MAIIKQKTKKKSEKNQMSFKKDAKKTQNKTCSPTQIQEIQEIHKVTGMPTFK